MSLQRLRWPSTPRYSCLCVISSPLVDTGPGSSLLTNRIQWMWWDVTSKIRFKMPVTSALVAISCSLACLLWEKQAAMLWVAPWGGPHDRERGRHRAPEMCQQPCKWAWKRILPSWVLRCRQPWALYCSLVKALNQRWADPQTLRDNKLLPLLLTYQ